MFSKTLTPADRLAQAELKINIALVDFTETARALDAHAETLLALAKESDAAATEHQIHASAARVLASSTQKKAARLAELIA